MASSLRVSVVIPTHRRRAALRRALLSLRDQTVGPGSFEAVVAVDGREDDTLQMLGELDLPFGLRWVAGERSGARRRLQPGDRRGEGGGAGHSR